MKYYMKEVPDPNLTECFANPKSQELLIDIFVPAESNHNGAAVIFIHGGAWNSGKRQSFLWHCHRLSLYGYTACSIDYRLSQTASFPAAVEDCQSAMKWLRDNAERFNIHCDQIGVVGSSAGGHLAACLGVFDSENSLSTKANCVVDIHGVHDFVSIAENGGGGEKYCEAFIGGSLLEKQALWIQASPALHVDVSTAPMLLVHDPEDYIVPYDQSLILANALIKSGRPMRFLPSPGSGHGFFYNPQNNWTQQVWPVAVTWLDHHLLGMTLTNKNYTIHFN